MEPGFEGVELVGRYCGVGMEEGLALERHRSELDHVDGCVERGLLLCGLKLFDC